MFKPWLILVIGAAGSGKTYFVANILPQLIWFHLQETKVGLLIIDGEEANNKAKVDEAVKMALSKQAVVVVTSHSDRGIDKVTRDAADLVVFTESHAFTAFFTRCSNDLIHMQRDKEYKQCLEAFNTPHESVIFDKSKMTLYAMRPLAVH